jgi:transposase
VRTAIAQPWGNGPVEGHVSRPKLIKRQMFGRVRSDLPRRRMLHAT